MRIRIPIWSCLYSGDLTRKAFVFGTMRELNPVPNGRNILPSIWREQAGVESIENGAFAECGGLTSVEIPYGVKSIGKSAFFGCSGLTAVLIPSGVKRIRKDAFKGCENATIYCESPSQPSTWDKNWNPDNRPVVWNYKPENN